MRTVHRDVTRSLTVRRVAPDRVRGIFRLVNDLLFLDEHVRPGAVDQLR